MSELESRVENILEATIEGTSPTVKPQSRVEILLNELNSKVSSASEINYDNQNSGLMADNVQEAIDELVAELSIVYGFHINGSESDPSSAVIYLEDAVGMTPASMDYENEEFNYGSWKDAFFMPRPCMLKFDGTVDYYLDPDDYTKKEDGTSSDVANSFYNGNAMMEWGQNGKKIWYKIVPDSDDNTSASVFISDHKLDNNFHAWSFINNYGELTDHFYTPIYNGSIDTTGRLRSISGKFYEDICQNLTVTQEVAAAQLNNPIGYDIWYTEVYSDVTLINLLLILMSKSLNAQVAYGNGRYGQGGIASKILETGTMDNLGLFYGYNDGTHNVKVFGMEGLWGNQFRRYAGQVSSGGSNPTFLYKLTKGTQDGSDVNHYVISDSASDYDGYLVGNTCPSSSGYVTSMQFNGNVFLPKEVDNGSSSTYWSDYFYKGTGYRYAMRGGYCGSSAGICGPFYTYLAAITSSAAWNYGASLSCKPLAS